MSLLMRCNCKMVFPDQDKSVAINFFTEKQSVSWKNFMQSIFWWKNIDIRPTEMCRSATGWVCYSAATTTSASQSLMPVSYRLAPQNITTFSKSLTSIIAVPGRRHLRSWWLTYVGDCAFPCDVTLSESSPTLDVFRKHLNTYFFLFYL